MIQMAGWLRVACLTAAVLLIPAVCLAGRLVEWIESRQASRTHRWRS